MYQPPPTDQSTFESQAQYNLQATEDVEEEQHSFEDRKKQYPVAFPKRPNYRPKPLRWPFITAMIVLLALLMGLVIFARTTMPNSDSTATIEPRHVMFYRRDVSSTAQPPSSAPSPVPAGTQITSSPVAAPSTSAAIINTPSQVVPSSGVVDTPKKSESQPPVTSTQDVIKSSAPPQVSSRPDSTPTSEKPPTVSASASKENIASSVRENANVKGTTVTSEPQRQSVTSPPSKDISETPKETSDSKENASSKDSATVDINNNKIPTSNAVASPSLDPDNNRNRKGKPVSTSSSLSNEGVVDLASTTDLSGQRQAPSIITTTLSFSRNTSPRPTPSRDDEVFSVITSEFTSTITKPGSTLTFTSMTVTNISSTFRSTFRTTFPGSTAESTFTSVITTSTPRTITRSASVSYSVTTMTMPGSTQTRTDTISDEKTTFYQTTTKTAASYVVTSTQAVTQPGAVETSYQPVESTVTSTTRYLVPPSVSEGVSEYTSVVQSTVQVVGTTTQPGQVYVNVGTTEITRVITIPRTKNGQGNNPPTQPPVFQVITSVIDGKVETIVDNAAPQTIVTNDGGVITVAFTPPPETKVTREGGQQTEMVITITPTPEVAYVAVPTTKDGTPTIVVIPSTLNGAGPGQFKEVATTIDGKPTVVNVPVTQEPVLVAIQTTIDGTPTVVLTRSTPTGPGFNPISLTIVSQVGGSTGVFTTTDAPEAIKTTIDGKETTVMRTPPPRTYTSVSGGTATTMTVVTTPTGTMPLSFTVLTSTGGTLSTIVSTPKPTTFTTSISGTLRTITSTPKPTTRLSTIEPSTALITSTSIPTATDSPDTIIVQVEKFAFTDGDYFVGKFLPVILAVIIAAPLRIIDLNAKLYQPFYALAQEGGSLGKNSMTLHFDGWKGFLAPFEVLMQGHPVPFITTLMILCSSLLAPLATEAIGMKLHGKCKITAIEGCGIQLGVSTMSAHALVALLAFIIVLLLVLLYFLRNWETGLHANPWSIAGISSLARNADIRSHQLDFKASKASMADKKYGFGYFENSHRRDEYGIIHYDDSTQNLQRATASGALVEDDELTGAHQRDMTKQRGKPVPFIVLTWWWRLTFMFFLVSMFIIILYYHLTLSSRTSFKDFMDSQTFGVRFFFTALGVTVVFCWQSIFISIAIISPYHDMARRSQSPEKSILLTRPTNGFYGMYAAVLDGNIILLLAAFMSILAEFLPILFANIPYNLTQTLESHNICARVSLAILAIMLITIIASLFIKWPEMPVDPRSIAGAMYYVNESRMLEDFEGLSKLDSKEREKRVKELGRRYFYGSITGRFGKRMGVESVESIEDTAYTGGHWFLPREGEQQQVAGLQEPHLLGPIFENDEQYQDEYSHQHEDEEENLEPHQAIEMDPHEVPREVQQPREVLHARDDLI
ncbi:uncharacterized protein CTRU02_202744 [Colletotrichum truncatum]|uniref:Uncharacterized protein n=1 Tax=Colletotrichum truncatum TaxID=5467 RepID=A0ACC3ZLR8_COLTU|nr:uncharacterized protein CTRU02_10668 [Colletotrichum truncatum]KAF6786969.1 hypothetical protein CTRU02_10668 [Colletotrichum truncatum]